MRGRLIPLIALLAAAPAGCTPGPTLPTSSTSPMPTATLESAEVRYAEGRSLDIYTPARDPGGALPVVVLLHGCCGDRSELVKLAETTAAAGAVVLNADWAGFGAAGRYPGAYEDVACAVRFARARAGAYGGDSSRVVLAGWSDGAMAAAAVTAHGAPPRRWRCAAKSGSGRPDGLVGLAGFYGWTLPVDPAQVTPRSVRFLGGDPQSAKDAWAAATPYTWAGRTYPVPTTVIVGMEDPLRAGTEHFASWFCARGWPVRTILVPYAGEPSLLSPRTPEGRLAAAETAGLLARRGTARSGVGAGPSCQAGGLATRARDPALGQT